MDVGTGAPSTSSGGGRSDPLNLNQVWCGYQRLTIIKNNHKIIDTSVSISNQFVSLYALITLLDGARMEPGGDSGNGGAEIVRFIGGFVRKFQGGFFWGILVSTVLCWPLWYLKCVRNLLITLKTWLIWIRHFWLFINSRRIGIQETYTRPIRWKRLISPSFLAWQKIGFCKWPPPGGKVGLIR